MAPDAKRLSVPRALGLQPLRPFHLDRLFWLAVAAGAGFCLLLALCPEHRPLPFDRIRTWHFASLALVQPIIEELVFRGLVQGMLLEPTWGRRRVLGLSNANLLTSVAFALAHLVHHAPIWSLAVLAPSLVFGFFRDRHGCAWPAILLHVLYNTCFFLAVGLP